MVLACTLAAAPLAALAAALIGRWSPDLAARVAAGVVGVGWAAAVMLAILHAVTPGQATPAELPNVGLGVDGVAVVMLLLVLGLSAVIQSFTVRYLRGDPRQLWFVVTANLLTGATAALVCTTTVVGFGIAWLAAGLALVALLRSYPHLAQARDGVRRTARRFLIADAALVAAIAVLLGMAGGDVRLAQLGSILNRMPPAESVLVAMLLVIPALARSSQVPFQGWLPATLAAPTPVSALMHAGVVNAGTILIMRFSAVIGHSSLAMSVIFGAGALTLLYASVVRLVKPDAKGRLVFSTMAQMGFMMLACGLGAFAAAVLHLVAHGMFKSALFLSASSGVGREATQRSWPVRNSATRLQVILSITLAALVSVGAIVLARTVLQVELSTATQALQGFVVFTAALTFATTLCAQFSPTTILIGSAVITALAFAYTALVGVFDVVIATSPVPAALSPAWLLAPGAGVLCLQLLLRSGRGNALTRPLYALALASGTPLASPSRIHNRVREGVAQ